MSVPAASSSGSYRFLVRIALSATWLCWAFARASLLTYVKVPSSSTVIIAYAKSLISMSKTVTTPKVGLGTASICVLSASCVLSTAVSIGRTSPGLVVKSQLST